MVETMAKILDKAKSFVVRNVQKIIPKRKVSKRLLEPRRRPVPNVKRIAPIPTPHPTRTDYNVSLHKMSSPAAKRATDRLIIRGTLRPDGSRDVLKIAEEKAKEKIEQQRIASSTSRPGSGWRDKRGTVYQNKKGVQDYWERNYRDIYNQSGIPLRSGNISARGFYDKGVVTMSKNIYPSEQEYREVALHEFGHAKTLERKKSTVLQETISGGLKEYMKEKKFVTDIRRKTGAFPQKIFYSNKVDNAILDKTAPPRDDSIFNSSYIKRHGYTSDQIPREIAANLYSKAVYGDNLGIKLPGFVSKPGINYSARDRDWVQNKVYTDIGLQKVNVKKDLTVQPVPSQRKRNISFFDINIKNKIW